MGSLRFGYGLLLSHIASVTSYPSEDFEGMRLLQMNAIWVKRIPQW
jgi:hypothetical protein